MTGGRPASRDRAAIAAREPVSEHLAPIEQRTSGDERLGKDRVGVAQAGLWPHPCPVEAGPPDGIDGASEQPARTAVARMGDEHISGTDRGERHRPGPTRALMSPPLERLGRRFAHRVLRRPSCGRAECPHRTAPAVIHRVTAVPTPVHRATVADAPVLGLRIDQEAVRHPGELDDGSVGERLTAGGDEHASDVVGAVPLLDPGFRVVSVLERPDRIAHRREVPEARLRCVHVLIPAATSSDPASSS